MQMARRPLILQYQDYTNVPKQFYTTKAYKTKNAMSPIKLQIIQKKTQKKHKKQGN